MKKNKLLESNENENTTCQNLKYNESKPKRELHSSKCLHKKSEKSQINKPIIHLRTCTKNNTSNHNSIGEKKSLGQKIVKWGKNKKKYFVLWKDNKTDKLLAKLTKRKRKMTIDKISDQKGVITAATNKIRKSLGLTLKIYIHKIRNTKRNS